MAPPTASTVDHVDRGDPVAVLRRWEASHHRHLVDPLLAGWDDLDSEAVLIARAHWALPVPTGADFWSRRRYLSFDADGHPERLIEVQLLTAHQPALRARHGDLLIAGALGARYWIYALTGTPAGDVQLRALQDPARSAWAPVPLGAMVGQDPLWVLPLDRVAAEPIVLQAA